MSSSLDQRKALIAQIAQRNAANNNFAKAAQAKALVKSGGNTFTAQERNAIDQEYKKLQLGGGGASGKFTNPFLD